MSSAISPTTLKTSSRTAGNLPVHAVIAPPQTSPAAPPVGRIDPRYGGRFGPLMPAELARTSSASPLGRIFHRIWGRFGPRGWRSAPGRPFYASSAARAAAMKSVTALAAPAASAASPTARTSRVPTITPSATAPTCAACSGVPMPNPTATGHRRVGLGGRDQLAERLRQPVALAGRAGVGDEVDEALGLGADPRAALRRRRRRDQRDQGEAGRAQLGGDLAALLEGQVGHDRARPPPRRRAAARTPRRRGPGSCSRRPSGPPAGARRAARRSAQHRLERRARRRARGSRLRGSPGRRRADRSTGPRARPGRRPRRRRRRPPPSAVSRSGKPPIMYGISAARPSAFAAAKAAAIGSFVIRRSSFGRRPRPGPCRRGHSESARRSRPAVPLFSSSQAIACEGSSAGMMPSSRASSPNAAQGVGRR